MIGDGVGGAAAIALRGSNKPSRRWSGAAGDATTMQGGSGRRDAFSALPEVAAVTAALIREACVLVQGPHVHLQVMDDAAFSSLALGSSSGGTVAIGGSFGRSGPLPALVWPAAAATSAARPRKSLLLPAAQQQVLQTLRRHRGGGGASATAAGGAQLPIVTLEAAVGSRSSATLRIANTGTTLLYFRWRSEAASAAQGLLLRPASARGGGTGSVAWPGTDGGGGALFASSHTAAAHKSYDEAPPTEPLLRQAVASTVGLGLASLLLPPGSARDPPVLPLHLPYGGPDDVVDLDAPFAPPPPPASRLLSGAVAPLLSLLPGDPAAPPIFLCARPSGSVLPGQHVDVTVTFAPAAAGTFRDTWQLVTVPPANSGVDVLVRVRGVATAHDGQVSRLAA